MSTSEPQAFVSRAGSKLAFALDHFSIDPGGLVCADLGSHVGGFVDCLLARGARKVYSVDTSYGTLAWKLRQDPRVVVMERTNAMHVSLPEAVDLVTIDVGWTRQTHILPRARDLLAPGGRIISLIKPHYEAGAHMLEDGCLRQEHLPEVLAQVQQTIAKVGLISGGMCTSPLTGHGGNIEMVMLLSVTSAGP